MAYRLPSERVAITPEDGPTIEVEPILAWPLYANALRLAGAYAAASTGAAELVALGELYRFFVAEAHPTWEILDHNGPIPATAAGMWRLPLDLALAFVNGWTETAEPKPSAADAVMPPGPARDAINAGLRRKKG